MNTYDSLDTISFAKIHPDAVIPNKREEDGCYDCYVAFDESEFTLEPHKATLVPTGLISAYNPKWRFGGRERSSSSKTNLGLKCGQIDSGYRGEWFVSIRNDNDIPVIISKEVKKSRFEEDRLLIPYTKAICQFALEEVPKIKILEKTPEEIRAYNSERGTGCLGSSNK